jgi:hypothetical protein
MYFRSWPFRIVPERSADLWADRRDLHKNLETLLYQGINRERSALYCVWGYLGAGKSHSLMHFSRKLRENNVLCLFAPFPRSISTYSDLYRQGLFSSLNFLDVARRAADLWNKLSTQGFDTKGEMQTLESVSRDVTEGWFDMAQVIITLGRTFYLTGQMQSPLCLLAKSWLAGDRLTKRELQKLGVSSYLKTDSDFVRATQSLIRLSIYKGEGCSGYKGVVWTLDDCHVLATLRGRRGRTKLTVIEQHLRDIFDLCPNGLILLLSFASRDRSRINDLMIGDIRTRVKHWIEIPPLLKQEAREFVIDLMSDEKVRLENRPDKCYPYTKEAIDWVIDEISQQTDLTPRNLMKFLDYVTTKAEDKIFPARINVEFLEQLQALEPYEFDVS